MKDFSKLSFDRKTVAKLNEEQLSSVKGGSSALDDKVKCRGTSPTKVCSTTSTTNII